MSTLNRRDFLKSTATAAGALSFPTIVSASALGRGPRPAAADRVTPAFIGTGNMGTNHVRGFLGDERAQVVAVSDVRPRRRSEEGHLR